MAVASSRSNLAPLGFLSPLSGVSAVKFRLFGKSAWDLGTVAAPWSEGRSIHDYILTQIRSGKSRFADDDWLPDEERVRGASGLGWVAGGMDGAFGHHAAGEGNLQAARHIAGALRELTEKATDAHAARLYSLLTKASAVEIVDPLLAAIRQDGKLRPERVQAVARWLATGAADREPVKIAIALLGIAGDSDDRDLLLTLGRHEEFTLYAAVALKSATAEPEAMLWELARHVSGWGRIQIVERLADTRDERIKTWLLREGYRNDVMYEYTALVCATTGDLLAALQADQLDAELLEGAGDILDTLIRGRGGPAPGIEAYPGGADATERYLQHLQRADPGLRELNIVCGIQSFLEQADGATANAELGWPQRKEELLLRIREIRLRPGWEKKISAGLASDDRRLFWEADQAAKAFGIDTWDVLFERLQRGEDYWYQVMQTGDAERIDKVVQFAEARLPLREIASGPGEELGLGPKFQAHSALDFVLQDLRRFPGRGWSLIRAGLQSPVVRNRNMAVQALAAWPRQQWPEEAPLLLKRALRDEPNANTSESMRKLLAGKSL
jgi:hypothetical protein